jgi:hypothetical protein
MTKEGVRHATVKSRGRAGFILLVRTSKLLYCNDLEEVLIIRLVNISCDPAGVAEAGRQFVEAAAGIGASAGPPN